jgi:hypothetical protein
MKLTHRQKLALIVLAIVVIPMIALYPNPPGTGFLLSALLLVGYTVVYLRQEPKVQS